MAVELGQVMVGGGALDGTLALAGSSVFKALKTLHEGVEGEEGGGAEGIWGGGGGDMAAFLSAALSKSAFRLTP